MCIQLLTGVNYFIGYVEDLFMRLETEIKKEDWEVKPMGESLEPLTATVDLYCSRCF